jgi:hypothetical protein
VRGIRREVIAALRNVRGKGDKIDGNRRKFVLKVWKEGEAGID